MQEKLIVKDFAKKVSRSEQSVYKRMKKDLCPFVSRENGLYVINSRALALYDSANNSSEEKSSSNTEWAVD